jgi:hypothetical protein
MNNVYGTPAGPSEDGKPASGSGIPAQYSSPVGSSGPNRKKKRMLRWGAGVTLAGVLVGGGTAFALAGGSAPAAAATAGQAATLNSALNTASSTSSTATPHVKAALARLRALGGVDGQATFHNKTGYHTLAYERGTIQSVNSADVVVSAPDGTTWTWVIVSDTVVRENGAKTTTSALATGDKVFVGGPVVSGNKDARLIVIRPAAAGSGSGSSSSGSSSSGASGSSSVSGAPGTSVS